jgi:bifunctional non-homologous end joining protein LigD
VVYFAFDLLHLDGKDLRHVPLETRKQALAALLPGRGALRYTDHIVGGGPALLAQACAQGAGGVVSKRREARYLAGENEDWVLVRCPGARGAGRAERASERLVHAGPSPAGSRAGQRKAPSARAAAVAVAVAGVTLSHPERVLYPDAGITKLALARYYEAVHDWLLPQVQGRPLALVRCPDGLAGQCFYMKHAMPSVATVLRRVSVREQTKSGDYLVPESLEGVIALVQMSVLEIHTWNSTADRLEEPDRAVFDLDPGPEVAWAEVVRAARTVRDRLQGLGLASFVKTTGGKGLHVVVPLVPLDWDACFTFSQVVAESIAAEDPARYTTAMPKAGREKKILLDYFRNRRGSTSVSAYSSRARPGAPVSTPLAWDEIDDHPPAEAFTVRTLPRRLAALRRDPWADYEKSRRPLSKVLEGIEGSPPKPKPRRRGK